MEALIDMKSLKSKGKTEEQIMWYERNRREGVICRSNLSAAGVRCTAWTIPWTTSDTCFSFTPLKYLAYKKSNRSLLLLLFIDGLVD